MNNGHISRDGQRYTLADAMMGNPFRPNTGAHARYELTYKRAKLDEKDNLPNRTMGDEPFFALAYQRGRHDAHRELYPDEPMTIIAC